MRVAPAAERASMADYEARYAVFTVLLGLAVLLSCCGRAAATPSACPCQDPSLCEPIKGQPKKEVLGFVTSETNWPGYNWTLLTTVALFADMNYSMLCHAHSKGVRVVLSASFNTSQLGNSTMVKVCVGVACEMRLPVLPGECSCKEIILFIDLTKKFI